MEKICCDFVIYRDANYVIINIIIHDVIFIYVHCTTICIVAVTIVL